MPSHESPRMSGFSLVELSIVLVIVGLLTGAILGGKSLIHASELRSISTDMSKYQSAIVAFREKYNGLPGDLNTASSYWPTQCVDIAGNHCGGNNDGKIRVRSEAAEAKWTVEELRAWQMLGLAGLIEGSYTGVWPIQYKISVPAARSGLGVYYVVYTEASNHAGNAILFSNGLSSAAATVASSGVVVGSINFGECYFVPYRTGCSSATATGGKDESAAIGGATLRPEDTFNLDSKMDDGSPLNGAVIGDNGNNKNGAKSIDCTVTSGSDTTYNVSVNTPECTLTMFLEN